MERYFKNIGSYNINLYIIYLVILYVIAIIMERKQSIYKIGDEALHDYQMNQFNGRAIAKTPLTLRNMLLSLLILKLK